MTVGLPPGRLACHYTVSAPWSATTERLTRSTAGMALLFHAAYSVARRAGIRGGVWMFHYLRLGSARFNRGVELGCRPGGHFHVLGDGWLHPIKLGARNPHEGWIVKNLRVRSSVRETARYLLSHLAIPVREADQAAGILPSGKVRQPLETVRWWGTMAYNRRLPKWVEPDPWCGVCKARVPDREWYRVEWKGLDRPPPAEWGVCAPGDWRAYVIDRTDGWGRGERVEVPV